MKNIIFSGDSFTWGEGLELYIENEPWISQRKKVSWDEQLEPLRNEESEKFRLENHFPGIVSSYFNVESKSGEKNGGDFASIQDTVNNHFDKENTIAIVLQLTQIGRFKYHFERNKYKKKLCNCEYCKTQREYNFNETPYAVILDMIVKLLDGKSLLPEEIKLLDALNIQEGIKFPKTLEEIDSFFNGASIRDGGLDDIIIHLSPIYDRGIESLYEDIVQWQKYCTVYVIDSWCPYWTSNRFWKHEGFKELFLPLLGKDGNYYKRYKEWEETFEFTRIQSEFEGTENGHPTLEQHRYLAKSIINQLEKDGFTPYEYEEKNNETQRS